MVYKMMMKRITAWILAICMIVLNSPLSNMKVRAEGATTVLEYKLKAQIALGTGSNEKVYSVPDSYITEVLTNDETRVAVKGDGNVFKLEPKKSYICKIEGPELAEHEVEFETMEDAGNILISADKSKVKDSGKSVIVKKDSEISYDDELGMDWILTTSDTDCIQIVDNKIKGVNKGTATVKCTAAKDSSVNKTITVITTAEGITAEGIFSMVYKVENEVWDDVDNSGITVKGADGTITPDDKGRYLLQWGESYTYTVKDKLGFVDKTAPLTVPQQNEGEVPIILEPVKPVFVLEGKNIFDSGTKIKKNEKSIHVSCSNYSSLFQPEKWGIKLNENIGDSQQPAIEITASRNEINTDYSTPKVQVLYNGKAIETKNLNTFDNYELEYSIGGVKLKTKIDVAYMDDLEKETGADSLKANQNYNVKSVKAAGMTDYICSGNETITPKYTEQNISVVLDGKVTLVEPKIQIAGLENKDGVYEGLYGTNVTLSINNMDSLLNGGTDGWIWSCKDDSGNWMSVEDGKLNFRGKADSEYTLKCCFGTLDNDTGLQLRVKKIKVSFADNAKLSNISKTYDGNDEFEFTYTINDEIFLNQDKKSIDCGNQITLTGIALDKDGNGAVNAGTYKKIRITDAKVTSDDVIESEAFDTSALVGKEQECNARISKLDTAVTFKNQTIIVQYMREKINRKETGERITFSIVDDPDSEYTEDEKRNLYDILFDYMDASMSIKDNKCILSEVVYGEENPNVQYTLDTLSDDNGKKYLKYNLGRQEFSNIDEMDKKISLSQEQNGINQVLTEDKKWINTNVLYATFNEAGKVESYDEYYDTFQFEKVTLNKNGEICSQIGSKLEENLKPSQLSGEKDNEYYSIVISNKKDKTSDVSAIAMFIRIVSEKNRDKVYETTIMGNDGVTYSIVNLYMDITGDAVEFGDSLKGIKVDTESKLEELAMKTAYMETGEKIPVIITDSYSDIQAVDYKFVEIDPNDDKWVANLEEQENSHAGWLAAKAKDRQEIELKPDLTDGDYVMFVRVRDKVGNVSTYVSHGFAIDNKPPELKFYLDDEEVKEKGLSDGIYKNQTQQVTIEAIEPNIKSGGVIVDIAATNHVGEIIPIQLDSKKIQAEIEDSKKSVFQIKADANYTIHVSVVDCQGRNTTKDYIFTIDTTPPEKGLISIRGFLSEIAENSKKGKIQVKIEEFVKSWNHFVELAYTVFLKDTAEVTMVAEDSISDVDILYFMSDKEYTEAQLGKIGESEWKIYDSEEPPKTKINDRAFFYMKVVDRAGNTSYFNTKGIITDTKAPIVETKISGRVNKNGFYNGDVKISVNVNETTGSVQNGVSGLQYVGYRVESNGKITETKAIIDNPIDKDMDTEKDIRTEKTFDIVLDAAKHNSNDVRVYITAIDNAGNVNQEEGTPIRLKIDSVSPVIDVAFDERRNGEYYNHTVTATVTIKERNLATKDVDLTVKSEHGGKAQIGKWSHSDNIGKSDDAVYTCHVTFDTDDDYEFFVDCKDKAGNKANKSFSDKFTLDKTVPVVDVTYNNRQLEENGYYNEAVTAIITITEHNFDAGKADIRVQAGEGASTLASGFHDNGDIHTMSVDLDRDGEYNLRIACVDEAGNEAEPYKGSTFHIDLTRPEIVIGNVKDQSANKDEVEPVITFIDENYDAEKAKITVRGENGGEISLDRLNIASRTVTKGEEFTLNFPKEEAVDDIYTLTAEMEDKAGNEVKDSIQFSVNRYGSVYTLGTETREWLTNGECSYIKEGKPVVIIETNVDEIIERSISYTTGEVSAETVEVKEVTDCSDEEKINGTYYESKELDNGNGWHQYQYTISEESFSEEGKYSIQIDSKDKADNHAGSMSSRHKEGSLEILFAVDQTAPSAVITGTENKRVYKEAEHTVLLDVQDNIALDEVVVYLNNKEYAKYKAEEIAKLKDGLIPVEVKEAITTQTIQLRAVDMAGNILGEKTTGEYDKEFEDFHILVTQNVFIQLLHTYWLIVVLGMVGVGLIFVVMKKRKEQ
ncbi:MAG: hypothetical protein K2L07_10890 [Lachnospiraceae bacterium]|nr:hypothetical protein [Lachnospiraceae bacterium]